MSVTPAGVPSSAEPSAAHSLPAPPPQHALPAPPSRGGLWRKIGLVLFLLAAAAFAAWRIHGNQLDARKEAARTVAAADRPIPVTTAPVASRTMPIYLNALGTVTAYNAVTIKTRVDGQLLSVNVREGQQVRQGQLLAVIDPRPYEAALAQAQGQLIKDQAAAQNNEAEANRYKALYNAGVVSKESEQAQIATSGQSTGTLDADRAAIQAARVNVAYTHITSPINGVAGLRQVDPGNIVHAADTTGLILVTQLQPIAVIFTLPEDQLPEVLKRMRAGQRLTVTAYDRAQSTLLATGTLLTVDNEIDPTTGTVKGKAVFNNSDGALFPNQFVNVRVILQDRADSLIVPAAAIQSGTNGSFVYVVHPGNPPAAAAPKPPTLDAASQTPTPQPHNPPFYVTAQPVSIDLTEGSDVILKSGVQAGDQVVVDGEEKLKPDSRVKPIQSHAAGPATAGAPDSNPIAPPAPANPRPRRVLTQRNPPLSLDTTQPPALPASPGSQP